MTAIECQPPSFNSIEHDFRLTSYVDVSPYLIDGDTTETNNRVSVLPDRKYVSFTAAANRIHLCRVIQLV
jgi:hypothetical protein